MAQTQQRTEPTRYADGRAATAIADETGVPETAGERVPKLVDVRLVSDGWIKKYVLSYEMPDGSPYEYESVSRKGLDAYRAELERNARGEAPTSDAVCIVPVLPDGSLLMIREFRYPLNAWCIAFPAGLVEPGEDLAAAVDRELREETGFRVRRDVADPVRPLRQSGYSSTGLGEENVRVVFADVERAGDAQPEANELIEAFVLPAGEVRAFLDANATPIGTRAQLVLEVIAARAGE